MQCLDLNQINALEGWRYQYSSRDWMVRISELKSESSTPKLACNLAKQ